MSDRSERYLDDYRDCLRRLTRARQHGDEVSEDRILDEMDRIWLFLTPDERAEWRAEGRHNV